MLANLYNWHIGILVTKNMSSTFTLDSYAFPEKNMLSWLCVENTVIHVLLEHAPHQRHKPNHTYIHTYIHTHTYTHVHKYIHTYILFPYKETHMHIYICVCRCRTWKLKQRSDNNMSLQMNIVVRIDFEGFSYLVKSNTLLCGWTCWMGLINLLNGVNKLKMVNIPEIYSTKKCEIL